MVSKAIVAIIGDNKGGFGEATNEPSSLILQTCGTILEHRVKWLNRVAMAISIYLGRIVYRGKGFAEQT